MKRARIFVSGIVQGVGYRWYVEDRARERGLKGYVRNLSDGRVEIIVEGEEEKIESLIRSLWKKRWARVDNVQVDWEDYKGGFEDFRIRF